MYYVVICSNYTSRTSLRPFKTYSIPSHMVFLVYHHALFKYTTNKLLALNQWKVEICLNVIYIIKNDNINNSLSSVLLCVKIKYCTKFLLFFHAMYISHLSLQISFRNSCKLAVFMCASLSRRYVSRKLMNVKVFNKNNINKVDKYSYT